MCNPLWTSFASWFDKRLSHLVIKNHHGLDTLEIFPRKRAPSDLFPPILIRISVTSPVPCGFLPRLALLLVTLFPNFVAASLTNYVYEFTGPCMKFCETCPGKRSFPTKEEAYTDATEGAPARSPLFSRSDMIYSEDGRRTLGSSQSTTCNEVYGFESPAWLPPSAYSNQRRILACFNLI